MYVDSASFQNHTNLDEVLGESHHATVFLIIYTVFVILIGVLGNGTVLYGSVRYNAINMDSTSVLLLRHVAVADMASSLLYYVPKLLTLITGRWVLGAFICHSFMFRYIPMWGEMMFIALLACHRVYLLQSPLLGGIRRIVMSRTIAGCWTWAVLSTVGMVTVEQGAIIYEPKDLDCSRDESDVHDTKSARILYVIAVVIQGVIPMIMSLLANAAVFCFLNKPGIKAIKTVSIVCWVFILSYVPKVVTVVMDEEDETNFVSLLSQYAVSINLIANPFVYSLTNKKFAFFLKKMFKCDLRLFGHYWSIKQNPGLRLGPAARSSFYNISKIPHRNPLDTGAETRI